MKGSTRREGYGNTVEAEEELNKKSREYHKTFRSTKETQSKDKPGVQPFIAMHWIIRLKPLQQKMSNLKFMERLRLIGGLEFCTLNLEQ